MSHYTVRERAKYWPVSPELRARYKDGTHTRKDRNGLSWYQNNKWHRDGDKPAIIWANGRLEWVQNGLYHRDGDKPAYIDADGSLEWFQNGQLHRSRGPARICPNGTLEWVIYDENITPEVRKWLNKKRWRGTTEQIVEFQLRFT